jgi:hypothetical protein
MSPSTPFPSPSPSSQLNAIYRVGESEEMRVAARRCAYHQILFGVGAEADLRDASCGLNYRATTEL